ncbi:MULTISPECIES: hypothetical protein [Thioclava]|uniref:hypothetical protein n=1 Tax=Thioclava TaxID=285107 RepID=UPI000B548BCA|nr:MULTISPECIES: hypothetical protein [Thioclava]OWY03364.1 hypothetical protein B6V76_11015 [Thioclava sp. IC9]WGT48905.1 hypothetical protein P0N61_11260 [Thioclava nitratireducens]
MQKQSEKDEWLTLASAARLAGRSYAWARDRAAVGVFERRDGCGRRVFVSAQSVRAAIARDRRVKTQQASESRRRRHLRLVVDNTK